MDLGLSGKACAVTGAGRGIGRAVAVRLAAEGGAVLLVARTSKALAEAAAECEAAGGQAATMALDVTRKDAGERIVDSATERFGQLDVLVNNAGAARWRRIDEVPDADWQAAWDLNVMAPLRAMRAAAPGMRERGWGRIVNVASTAGKRPSALMPEYSVAKVAELSLSRLFADLYDVPGKQRKERMNYLLEFSRLTNFQQRHAEHLSGGMKKKLALACTLIHQPEVILLDEPTTGVDPVSRRELWRILFDLLRTGVTIVVTTPYMDEAELCNRVGFITGGRLLVTGTPAELARLPQQSVIELKARPRKLMQAAAQDIDGVGSIQIFGDRLHLLTGTPDTVSAVLEERLHAQGAEILTLRTIQPSMEDVFMHLTRRDEQNGQDE